MAFYFYRRILFLFIINLYIQYFALLRIIKLKYNSLACFYCCPVCECEVVFVYQFVMQVLMFYLVRPSVDVNDVLALHRQPNCCGRPGILPS